MVLEVTDNQWSFFGIELDCLAQEVAIVQSLKHCGKAAVYLKKKSDFEKTRKTEEEVLLSSNNALNPEWDNEKMLSSSFVLRIYSTLESRHSSDLPKSSRLLFQSRIRKELIKQSIWRNVKENKANRPWNHYS